MSTDFTRPSSDTVEALRASVESSRATLLGELGELVAIPGIAWDSFDQEPLERSAKAVAALIEAEGFDSVGPEELVTEEGMDNSRNARCEGRQYLDFHPERT